MHGREAIKNMLPMQPGDVHSTCADVSGSPKRWAIARASRSKTACPLRRLYRDYYAI